MLGILLARNILWTACIAPSYSMGAGGDKRQNRGKEFEIFAVTHSPQRYHMSQSNLL